MDTYVLYFLTVLAPLVWSPGPNNIMCATAGANQGLVRSIPFIAGLNIPIFAYSIATGLGLGMFITKFPVLQFWLPILASIYVVYLGLKLISTRDINNTLSNELSVKDGFAISSMNLKVVSVLALLFIRFSFTNSSYINVFFLSFAFVLMCACGHLIWSMIGAVATKLLENSNFFIYQNYVFGITLVVTGILMNF